ncbi:MAG: holin family protein [Pseudomonadota bacterium]
MGLIGRVLTLLFGGGNVIRDTAEVFVENAEAGAVRDAAQAQAALGQFAAEFAVPRQGVFDRAMDGINRLPRPMMALGTLGLFGAAMFDPVWFAARMEGIALVPEPLWWLLGVIVSFYFGARHQAKGHAYQRNLVESLARTRSAARALQSMEAEAGTDENPALEAWRAGR